MAGMFGALTPWQRRLLAGLGSLLALVLLIRAGYLPVVGRIGERKAALQSLRAKVAEARALIDRRPMQDAALREAQARAHAFEERAGDGQSVARALELIAASAKQHHLQLMAVKPRTDVHDQRVISLGEGSSLREVPLSLQVIGRYRQVGEFLGALAQSPFLASVRKVTLVRQQSGSAQLQGDLELALYFLEQTG